MCPLKINDFPEGVREHLVDLIESLELFPLKVTNDYDYQYSWSYFTDSDRISFLVERLYGYPQRSDSPFQSPFQRPPKRPYVEPRLSVVSFRQLSLF